MYLTFEHQSNITIIEKDLQMFFENVNDNVFKKVRAKTFYNETDLAATSFFYFH